MIILFVFAETKIIKKADSHNRNQPKFYYFKKFLEDSSNIKKITYYYNNSRLFYYNNLTSESNYSAAGVSVSAVAFLLRRVRPAFLAAFSLSMFSL